MRKVSREVGVRKRRWGRDGGRAGGGIKVRRQESLVGTRVQGKTKGEGEGDQFRREM